ncbi:MAG TPA: hypothetical protein VF680_16730 [Allosphingosinicella sp.]|jgi:hypothetical protein
MNCINKNTQEFKTLLEATKLPSIVLEMRISKWQENNGLDSYPSTEDIQHPSEVNFTLKAVNILTSDKGKEIFEKGKKAGWDLNKILTELQVPKEQKQLLLDLSITDREQLAVELAATYSYSVNINTTQKFDLEPGQEPDIDYEIIEDEDGMPIEMRPFSTTPIVNTKYYSNLTVPGGTNYTEQEISTPLITPSIKGHAQFATDKGIGWFRSDEQAGEKIGPGYENGLMDENGKIINSSVYKNIDSKTRRILEVQSDLFQKGRDKVNLVGLKSDLNSQEEDSFQRHLLETGQITQEEFNNPPIIESLFKENQFLQLLNKDSNWVTFFIKSIIQDSAKKGYEKVLFPSGNTASKVEGHETLENFVEQKQSRINYLEEKKKGEIEWVVEEAGGEEYKFSTENDANNFLNSKEFSEEFSKPTQYTKSGEYLGDIDREINQLTQEIKNVRTDGLSALKPIYDFYENKVQNIIKKQGYNPTRTTDEHGNDWFEITIDNTRDTSTIFAKKIEDLIDPNSENIFPNESNIRSSVIPDYSAEHSRILFNNKQGKITVDEILENILNNFNDLSPKGRELIEKSRRLVGRTGAKFKFISDAKLISKNTLMQIDGNTNTIEINRDRLKNFRPSLVVESFIHEVVHAQSIQALMNPQTFEEKEFKRLIDDKYRTYLDRQVDKELDRIGNYHPDLQSYGFTNEKEFVAEIYANAAFREELRQLDKENNTSFWKQFIEAVRRLFGIAKSTEANDLIEQVVDFVEQDRRDYQGMNLQRKLIFAKKTVEIPNLTSLAERLINLSNKAKDRMDQAYKRAQNNRDISPEKRAENLKDIQTVIDEMASFDDINQWKVITSYTQSLADKVNSLKVSFEKKDVTHDGLIKMINNYEDYLSSYDLLPGIQQLIGEARREQLSEEDLKDVNELDNIIRTFEGNHSRLLVDFKVAKEAQSIEILSDPRFNTKVETDNRIRLQKEYRDLKITGESMSEYVSRMMNTRDAARIKEELHTSALELINNPSFDISKMEGMLYDSTNTNSRLIQIVMNIISSVREKVISRFNAKNAELGKLYKDFINEKGNPRPSELYKNMYEQDAQGNYYLKGEYKVEFRDKYINEFLPLNKAFFEVQKRFKEEGFSFYDYNTFPEFIKVRDARRKWLKENTIKDASDITKKAWLPHPKYKNKDLTGTEARVLSEFRNITIDSDQNTGGKRSLIRKIDNKGNKLFFFKLPAHSKTDFERRLEVDVKGLTKDKWTDLTTIKADDIGYAYGEAIDSKNETLKSVKVHFRGKIDPTEQSLDLMTMYRYEFLNGVNYAEKSKEELTLNLLADISKNKSYIKRSNRSGLAMMNVFAKREPLTTYDGEFSQEYKRIQGIIESNIYDITSYAGGKLGPLDVNKLSSAISGYTAQVSMIFNAGTGVANVLNGTTQLFIESLGSKFITKKSLLKAEAKYNADLPQIMSDLSNPHKTSFTNQVLRMFDTFGGFSPEQQTFLKNTIARKLGSTESLNAFQEMGEHMMNSVLTMGVLDTLKVMNENHQFIDKDGNVVEESKAASLLDMLKRDSQGELYMDEKVAYTNHNMNVKYHKGGKVHVNLLIKKKSHDLFGVYDPNFQNELYKTWYGKAIMMFKKFFIAGAQYRYKGFQTSTKSKEELSDEDLIYNSAIKEYDEGVYTSLIRFFAQGVIPTLKNLSLSYTKDYYNNMTDFERANLRKATAEILATSILIPAIGMLLAAAGGEDDDDKLWFWIYQTRRLESELSQFRNIIEAGRLIQNPIAGVRTIQNATGFLYEVLTPLNFMPDDKENFFSYLDENSKGENILWKKTKKMTPIISQWDKDYQTMHNFINKK